MLKFTDNYYFNEFTIVGMSHVNHPPSGNNIAKTIHQYREINSQKFIWPVSFLITIFFWKESSPLIKLSRLTPNKSLSWIKRSISGYAVLSSHFEIACLLTLNFSAKSPCVQSWLFLSSLIRSPNIIFKPSPLIDLSVSCPPVEVTIITVAVRQPVVAMQIS